MEHQKTMLAIGAHMDDCQCGSVSGLSKKLANRGWRVVYLNTFAPKLLEDAELAKIADASAACVGAENINLASPALYDISKDTATIKKMAEIIRGLNPELIFIPWVKDNHYDHTNSARAALMAISYMNIEAPPEERVKPNLTDIVAYEISSWQTRQFEPDFFIDITNEIDAAEASIRAFTQFSQATLDYYAREKRARSASWGVRAGCAFAEGYKYIGPGFPLKSPLASILGDDLRPVGCLQYPWGGFLYD